MQEYIQPIIKEYGITGSVKIECVDAGFLSANYKLITEQSAFFLKGYRNARERVREIHSVKSFFASYGIPVLLPLLTLSGDTCLEIDGKVFALFPFVVGMHFDRQSIPNNAVISIAKLVARMHKVATENRFSIKTAFEPWDDEKTMEKVGAILKIINARSVKSDFDLTAEHNIHCKVQAMGLFKTAFSPLKLEGPILIHGDFHEQNIFFNKDASIQYVFDFGEVKMGYRTHELWRSADYMFLNGIFSNENISKTILYFKSYNKEFPVSREALTVGFEVYFQKHIHSFWVEGEHYLKNNTRIDHFIDTRSTVYLIKHKQEFLKQVLCGVYGN